MARSVEFVKTSANLSIEEPITVEGAVAVTGNVSLVGTSAVTISGTTLGLDEELPVIQRTHNEIHGGKLFESNVLIPHGAELADDANFNVLLVTGAKEVHSFFFGSFGGDAELYLYEDTEVSANGNEVAAVNLNRNSENTPVSKVYNGPTVTGVGTQLFVGFVPGGSGPRASGGTAEKDTEWLLAPNKNYLMRITNRSGSSQQGSLSVYFYEEEV